MIAPMALVVLGLAGYRLTRLLVLDTILDGPRVWLLRRLTTRRGIVKPRPWRAKLAELIQCTYCVGVWVTAGLCAWWHWVPAGRPLVYVAAAIGLQALLNGWDD